MTKEQLLALKKLLVVCGELISIEPECMGDPDDSGYQETALGIKMLELWASVQGVKSQFEKELLEKEPS